MASTPGIGVFRGATAGANGSTGAVPKPLAGQETLFLRGDATWASGGGGGGGNVTGPVSSTNNAIATYSGTSGTALLNTGVTIDGSNNISGANNIFGSSFTIGSLTGVLSASSGVVSTTSVYTTIQSQGSSATKEPILNFASSNFTVTNNAGNTSTDITLSSTLTGLNLSDYTETIHAASASTSYAINFANGNWHEVTMSGNTAFTFSNVPATSGFGVSLTLALIQDATGSRVPTFAASVDWGAAGVPTFSTAANAVDVVVMTSSNNGTRWRAFLSGKGFGG